MSAGVDLATALERCLADVEAGAAVETAVGRYPEHAAALRSLVVTALAVQRRRPRPPAAWRVAAEAEVLAAVSGARTAPPWFRTGLAARALAALAVVTVVVATVVVVGGPGGRVVGPNVGDRPAVVSTEGLTGRSGGAMGQAGVSATVVPRQRAPETPSPAALAQVPVATGTPSPRSARATQPSLVAEQVPPTPTVTPAAPPPGPDDPPERPAQRTAVASGTPPPSSTPAGTGGSPDTPTPVPWLAVLAGRVTRADGSPLPALTVTAYYEWGGIWRRSIRQAFTDPSGAYVLFGMFPGRYKVVAFGGMAYLPFRWHPGVDAPQDATIVELAPGAQRWDVDVRYPLPATKTPTPTPTLMPTTEPTPAATPAGWPGPSPQPSPIPPGG